MTRSFFTLKTKLFLAFFLLSALITLAISFELFVHMRTDHLNTLKRDLAVIASLALTQEEGRRLSEMVVAGDHAAIGQAAEKLRQRLTLETLAIDKVSVWQVSNSVEYVYLADSELAQQGSVAQSAAIPSPALPPDDMNRPMVVEVPNSNFEIIVYAPLKDAAGKTMALVGITVNGSAVAGDVRHFVIQVANVAVMAIMVVGVISWWLARGFSRRLSRLHAAIDEIAAGNIDVALPDNGQDEVAVLASRLNQLAVTLSSEREEMLLSAIESLVAALEAKDAYTYGHSSQVSAIASAIGRQIGLSEQELFNVRIAALLHDIGKIGVPDQILNKPGRLDETERQTIEQHPVIGAKILAGIPALARVTDMVKHHHARWDGKGYPEALAGEEIPLGARIIAVADAYQAMTSDRPYRSGMAADVAMAELRRYAGSQFDPKLVAAFAEVWSECPKFH
ncbi:metal dependent phosphohydrolase [Thermosinus carboxydivorans Nor1]|uniref:Metal dependent phosphohydrolase n=1 Tax=Thermosinus carboxydivorans Nor1 TaxID=401526 RepID=A1HRL7_9FIRM|nr:HD domain-containing phosphohydrolase [Thermosinus carboxydivorans]EAX47344.1 metal dependent phosphohydrolase [Thermosinus carboxydivorans Nor1]